MSAGLCDVVFGCMGTRNVVNSRKDYHQIIWMEKLVAKCAGLSMQRTSGFTQTIIEDLVGLCVTCCMNPFMQGDLAEVLSNLNTYS